MLQCYGEIYSYLGFEILIKSMMWWKIKSWVSKKWVYKKVKYLCCLYSTASPLETDFRNLAYKITCWFHRCMYHHSDRVLKHIHRYLFHNKIPWNQQHNYIDERLLCFRMSLHFDIDSAHSLLNQTKHKNEIKVGHGVVLVMTGVGRPFTLPLGRCSLKSMTLSHTKNLLVPAISRQLRCLWYCTTRVEHN